MTKTSISGRKHMIVVVGSTGQLGSDLVKVLGGRCVGITHKEMNIAKFGNVRDVLTAWMPEWVINCAAVTDVDRCEIEPEHAFNVNVRGVFNLAQVCRSLKCGLIHISTDFVFGDKGPFQENRLPCPLNVYGATKFAGETIAFGVNPKTVVVRTASLYGVAGCSGKGRTNFVEKVLGAKGEMKVVDDIIMSPTYAGFLAEKIAQLLYMAPEGLYHIAGTGSTSWFGFAVEVAKQAKLKLSILPIKHKGTLARRPLNSSLADTRLAGLGRLPNWQAGVTQYLKDREEIRND